MDANPIDEAKVHFNPKEFLIRAVVGLVFLVPVIIPIVFLTLQENAEPTWIQLVVIYVCLALAAGIIFSAATISTGKVGWPKISASLGGGAAIGVIVLLTVHRLLPPPSPVVIVTPTRAGLPMSTHGPAINGVHAINSGRYVIERSTQGPDSDAWVVFTILEPTNEGTITTRTVRYEIGRTGRVKNQNP